MIWTKFNRNYVTIQLGTHLEFYEDYINNHDKFHPLVLKYGTCEKFVTAYLLLQLCQTLKQKVWLWIYFLGYDQIKQWQLDTRWVRPRKPGLCALQTWTTQAAHFHPYEQHDVIHWFNPSILLDLLVCLVGLAAKLSTNRCIIILIELVYSTTKHTICE